MEATRKIQGSHPEATTRTQGSHKEAARKPQVSHKKAARKPQASYKEVTMSRQRSRKEVTRRPNGSRARSQTKSSFDTLSVREKPPTHGERLGVRRMRARAVLKIVSDARQCRQKSVGCTKQSSHPHSFVGSSCLSFDVRC